MKLAADLQLASKAGVPLGVLASPLHEYLKQKVEISFGDGRGSQLRGYQSEQRALRLAEGVTLPWVSGARLAILKEDHMGIDLVVSTDRGDIWVQVKSSLRGVRKFRRRFSEETMAVIVVGDRSDEEVLRSLEAELTRVRGLLPVRSGTKR